MRMRMRMRMRDSASITCLIRRLFDRQNLIIIFVVSRKWCFFLSFRFLLLVFQVGIAAVLHGVRPKCVFAFRQANTRQKRKTP